MRKRDLLFIATGLMSILTSISFAAFLIWCFSHITGGNVYWFWEPNPYILWFEVFCLVLLMINNLVFLILAIWKIKSGELWFL